MVFRPSLPRIEELTPRRPVGFRNDAAFCSNGWGGGAVKTIEEKLGKAGMEIVTPALTVKWVPDKNEISRNVSSLERNAQRK